MTRIYRSVVRELLRTEVLDPTPLSLPLSQMQALVQKMLHSEYGVPIRSHKRRLISAIPSAFTGEEEHNLFSIVCLLCVVLIVTQRW